MARPEKIRLGDLLIQQGLLTDEQLKFALDEQKRSGRKLGRIVVESSFVTEEAISKALARQLQVSYVDLKHFNPKQNLINLLPEALKELSDIAETYFLTQLERGFYTLDFYKSLRLMAVHNPENPQ